MALISNSDIPSLLSSLQFSNSHLTIFFLCSFFFPSLFFFHFVMLLNEKSLYNARGQLQGVFQCFLSLSLSTSKKKKKKKKDLLQNPTQCRTNGTQHNCHNNFNFYVIVRNTAVWDLGLSLCELATLLFFKPQTSVLR